MGATDRVDEQTRTRRERPPCPSTVLHLNAPTIVVHRLGTWTNSGTVGVRITASDNTGGAGNQVDQRHRDDTHLRAVRRSHSPSTRNTGEGNARPPSSARLASPPSAPPPPTEAGNTRPAGIPGEARYRPDGCRRHRCTRAARFHGMRGRDSLGFTCADTGGAGIRSCELVDETKGQKIVPLIIDVRHLHQSPPLPRPGRTEYTVTATDNAGITFTSVTRRASSSACGIALTHNPNTPRNIGSAYAVSITLCAPIRFPVAR